VRVAALVEQLVGRRHAGALLADALQLLLGVRPALPTVSGGGL